MGAVCRVYFFYLSFEVVWVPEADQLNQNFSGLIRLINERKVRDHDRITQKQHFTFAKHPPVSPLAAHFLLKLMDKIFLKTAINYAGGLELDRQQADNV